MPENKDKETLKDIIESTNWWETLVNIKGGEQDAKTGKQR